MLKGCVDRTAQTQQCQDCEYRDECCALVLSFPRVLRRTKSAIGPIQAPPNPHSQEHRGDDMPRDQSDGLVASNAMLAAILGHAYRW